MIREIAQAGMSYAGLAILDNREMQQWNPRNVDHLRPFRAATYAMINEGVRQVAEKVFLRDDAVVNIAAIAIGFLATKYAYDNKFPIIDIVYLGLSYGTVQSLAVNIDKWLSGSSDKTFDIVLR